MRPLEGLKVMDLAWVVAGPLIGRTLADFGACVVRIESSTRAEAARLMGPFPGGTTDIHRSVLFDNCNANKWGLSLDLGKPEARAVALDLVRWADVVIESFMPGQMARFGMDYATLKQINPSVVMLSSSLMGQTGPQSQMSGYGNIGAALAGFQTLVGNRGELPVGPFGPYTDYVAPRFSLVTLLAALDHRHRTGEGCFIDISQTEAGIGFLAPQIADYCATGRVAEGDGNRDACCSPHGVFQALGEDCWIAIAVRDDEEWQKLARIIGGEALANDPRFGSLEARKGNEDALEAIVSTWTATRAAFDIEEQLQAVGIPAHRAVRSEEFVNDPQLLARDHLVRIGESVVENARYRLSETPAAFERSAPTPGRDNDYVLGELLGYSAERISALRAAEALR